MTAANFGYMNQMGSAASAAPSGGGFSGRDWASIIQGFGTGAGNVFQSMAKDVSSKKSAKEAKRKLMAKLLNNAMNREFKTRSLMEGEREENKEFQAEGLQDVARGFVDSLRGSTRRG